MERAKGDCGEISPRTASLNLNRDRMKKNMALFFGRPFCNPRRYVGSIEERAFAPQQKGGVRAGAVVEYSDDLEHERESPVPRIPTERDGPLNFEFANNGGKYCPIIAPPFLNRYAVCESTKNVELFGT